jgi:hypothetical protein
MNPSLFKILLSNATIAELRNFRELDHEHTSQETELLILLMENQQWNQIVLQELPVA